MHWQILASKKKIPTLFLLCHGRCDCMHLKELRSVVCKLLTVKYNRHFFSPVLCFICCGLVTSYWYEAFHLKGAQRLSCHLLLYPLQTCGCLSVEVQANRFHSYFWVHTLAFKFCVPRTHHFKQSVRELRSKFTLFKSSGFGALASDKWNSWLIVLKICHRATERKHGSISEVPLDCEDYWGHHGPGLASALFLKKGSFEVVKSLSEIGFSIISECT